MSQELWALSMTYDWMDDRHYDEAYGPSCGSRKTPQVVYRKSEDDRIWAGRDRDGNRIDDEGGDDD
mgnify:FL=1|tara:strand:- start:308 stop:505 length:198 start_codon:yes stop_codon:yes gene_type:complete